MAGSRYYRPIDNEATYFNQSKRCILPNDFRSSPSLVDKKTLVNWTGIIKNISTSEENDSIDLKILVEHKYWDFIEDFSIQDEKIFLSENGEGDFYFYSKYPKDLRSKVDSLSNNYKVNDFIICYGFLKSNDIKIPELEAQFSRIIPSKFYSTKIMKYDAKKNENGRTVCNEKNSYELVNFKSLKIPAIGQNK
ncbi:MAG: hypothetical protein DI529_14450 [Chryseobacterium sp.]|nr:MAG: hypothetical protein DI529_14450 [Chryseobacterium sp.]